MLHNASAYTMGEVRARLSFFIGTPHPPTPTYSPHARTRWRAQVCLFFIGMGFVMIAEEMILGNLMPKGVVKLGAKMPTFLCALLLTLTSCLLFDPLYMASWRKAGMLPSMADLVVTVRCAYK